MLSINGVKYTAEQYGPFLVSNIQNVDYTQSPTTPEELGQIMDSSFGRNVCALAVLAKQLNITITDAELTKLKARAETIEGFYGLTKETWLWIVSNKELYEKVTQHYKDRYKGFGESAYHNQFTNDLMDIYDNVIYPSMQTLDAFDSLDMQAIWKRSNSGPDYRNLLIALD